MVLRPEGPGKDFDDMWNKHRREAFEKKTRGEGPWAADASLDRLRDVQPQPPTGGKHAKPSSDSCVTALGILGGLAWALSEAVERIL